MPSYQDRNGRLHCNEGRQHAHDACWAAQVVGKPSGDVEQHEHGLCVSHKPRHALVRCDMIPDPEGEPGERPDDRDGDDRSYRRGSIAITGQSNQPADEQHRLFERVLEEALVDLETTCFVPEPIITLV